MDRRLSNALFTCVLPDPHVAMPATPTGTGGLGPDRQERSFFDSIRKLSRKSSNSSRHAQDNSPSQDSRRSTSPQPQRSFRGPVDLVANSSNRSSHSQFSNPSPATRRPDRAGMNAFTVPSNEPPPAYTPSPTTMFTPTIYQPQAGLSESAARLPNSPSSITASSGEDPYAFLTTFNTVLLIDDSGSMAGRGWREVSQALSLIAPIVTAHDHDGLDIYFLNHKSNNVGDVPAGVAPGGYRGIKRASTVAEIFDTVRPAGGTPTGIRVHNVLRPYLTRLEEVLSQGAEMKPLNLIVLTDGVPSDDVESVILSAAKKLDKIDAPPFQVGVQFFQVGNEEGAKEALEELDDGIAALVEGGVRDIVDTMTWNSTEGGISLTGDFILKCVLGAVNRRLDRRRG